MRFEAIISSLRLIQALSGQTTDPISVDDILNAGMNTVTAPGSFNHAFDRPFGNEQEIAQTKYQPIEINDQNGISYLDGEGDIAIVDGSLFGGIVGIDVGSGLRQMEIRLAELFNFKPISDSNIRFVASLEKNASAAMVGVQNRHSRPFGCEARTASIDSPDCGASPQAVIATINEDGSTTIMTATSEGIRNLVELPDQEPTVVKEFGPDRVLIATKPSGIIVPPEASSEFVKSTNSLYLLNTENGVLQEIILNFEFGSPVVVNVGDETFLAVVDFTDSRHYATRLFHIRDDGWAQPRGESFPGVVAGEKLKVNGDLLTASHYNYNTGKTEVLTMKVNELGLIVSGDKRSIAGEVGVLGAVRIDDIDPNAPVVIIKKRSSDSPNLYLLFALTPSGKEVLLTKYGDNTDEFGPADSMFQAELGSYPYFEVSQNGERTLIGPYKVENSTLYLPLLTGN